MTDTDMDRRAFFKRGIEKVSRSAVNYAENKANQSAVRWFRPPYAQDELDFILNCSRCGDCISACEYEVIFPLQVKYGSSVVNTPALDLTHKACHLCHDWPCVNACEPGALRFPEPKNNDEKNQTSNDSSNETGNESINESINETDKESTSEEKPMPKMALAKISRETCLPYLGPECGACRSSCPVDGALTWDLTKPAINAELCSGCGMCREACITDPSSITLHKLAVSSDKQL